MAIHPVAEAFPNGSVSYDTIQQKLADCFPLVLTSASEIQSINFNQAGAVVVPQEVRLNGVAFLYDSTDTTTAHDGVACLVSQDGKRFKTTFQPTYFVNVLSRTNTPPGSPVAGDRYIVGAAPSGAWASNSDDLAVYNGLAWVFVAPVIGQTVYVRDVEGLMHWGESGAWLEGAGSFSVEAGSIGAQELAFPWGMTVESETATPAGTRASSGVTPTMPLGGTAANINDDNTGTTATTSALGDLSAAALTSRIVARLDLGSVQALAGIQAKTVSRSSGSNAGWGLYYSSDGTTYTLLGSTFTVDTTPTEFARAGTFNARYLALVAPQANYSTVTLTLSDLNAYKQATSIADGVKYIVAANGIGVFSGQATKVAEAWGGAYRFYSPYDGASVMDKAIKAPKRYDSGSGAWISSGGVWVGISRVFTAAASAGLTGSGSSAYVYNETTAPTTANHHVADPVTLSYTAKRAGSKLRLIYEADVKTYGTGGIANGIYVSAPQKPVIAVKRDSETNFVAWQRLNFVYLASLGDFLYLDHISAVFEFDAVDAAAHTYTLVITAAYLDNGSNDVAVFPTVLARRNLTIEEGA